MEGFSVKIETIIRRLNGDLKDDIFSNKLDAETIRNIAIDLNHICQTINSEESVSEMNKMKQMTKEYEEKYNSAILDLDKLENELELAKMRNSSSLMSNQSSLQSVPVEKKFAFSSYETFGSDKENINPEEELNEFRRRLTLLEKENLKLMSAKEQVFSEIEEKCSQERKLETQLQSVSYELNGLKEMLKFEQESRGELERKADEMEIEVKREESRVRNLEQQNEILKENCRDLLEHLALVESEMKNVLDYREVMRKEYNEKIIHLESQLKRKQELCQSAERYLCTPDHKISSYGKTINTQIRANFNSSVVKTTKRDPLPSIQTKSPVDFCYDHKQRIQPFNDRYNTQSEKEKDNVIIESNDAFSSGLSFSQTGKEESIKKILGDLKLEETNEERKKIDEKMESRKNCLQCSIY